VRCTTPSCSGSRTTFGRRSVNPDLASSRAPAGRRLEAKEAELQWLSRILELKPWPQADEASALGEPDESNASALNELAWDLVNPAARVYGRELEALALARRAVELATEEDRATFRDTLAWALLWTGKIDDALAEETRALADVGPDKRAEYEGYLRRMEAEARSLRDGAAAARREALATEVATLEVVVAARRTFRFGQSDDEWWHRQLVRLEAGLVRLRGQLDVAERSVHSPENAALWSEAIEAIATSERYRGVRWPSGDRLTPQLGLVPIGPDPDSGLWEFAHLATGEPARRGADRKLVLRPEVGLVLVLLAGGRVPVAANASDRQDASLTEIDLDPFFLSKYEMTQAQWSRIRGWERSGRAERTPSLMPASDLSWDDCQVALQGNAGWLRLPSEAQWEFGCRATTTTTWWPGDRAEDLLGVAHLAFDREDNSAGGAQAIGALRANPFGLHDVHGNLWEWCQDALGSSARRTGDGLRDEAGAANRVGRGGAFWNGAANARSSLRSGSAPDNRDGARGLRPARGITP
jgi:formylglycine-generating enzyme required for sulfatase activity